MPNNPPVDTPEATPSGGADTPAVRADPTQDPRKERHAQGGEQDVSGDGGGQRTEVGRPYDGEGNERGIPPQTRR